MKAKSDYGYVIDQKILFIEDRDLGNRSVTNDIENVLSDIIESEKNNEGFLLDNYSIIYRDSSGSIDGVETRDNRFLRFYSIGEDDYEAAIKKVKKK